MSENSHLLNLNLSQESTITLYHQLLTLIRHEIQNELLKPGDLLSSEMQLCSCYNLGRSTVR